MIHFLTHLVSILRMVHHLDTQDGTSPTGVQKFGEKIAHPQHFGIKGFIKINWEWLTGYCLWCMCAPTNTSRVVYSVDTFANAAKN